ncbi:hypothetical protein COY93_03255 [Candidatus Uhrbacteria bacterium CG_4_10_14_0_8_um_filter_58_22]|uniref:Uncharacterized protein n=1 Tax=Candidatus Uhrbacteria bacterium CG_4_10_14_0_8_um_filter_58_22 TaxID=1975029 RepID=A0A2M7QAE3_9BACT|nr:MAG: hypothetical protein AUJ19_01510 [Parcubacteria group bacterium CG1_02_58_44]PIY62406.1 MAG: hypothetical protein COY93_03255 [Candidatus Uhrbacteria bacterium CG_4_10_14_0_8_um_filter_58_22]
MDGTFRRKTSQGFAESAGRPARVAILNRTAGKFIMKVDSRAVRYTIPDGLRLEASLTRGFRLFVYKGFIEAIGIRTDWDG